MITVRHSLVTARHTVFVCGIVAGAAMRWSATHRICVARLDYMLVNMVSMRMMQVSIMQVVDMITVADGGMTAFRTVLMRVPIVRRLGACRHD